MAQLSPKWSGRSCLLCPGNSDINLFFYGKGIINLYAKIPDGAFDLSVSERSQPIMHVVTGANFRAEGESESGKCDSSYE